MDGAAKSAMAASKASVIIFNLGVLPYFVNNRVQLCSFREPVYEPLLFPGSKRTCPKAPRECTEGRVHQSAKHSTSTREYRSRTFAQTSTNLIKTASTDLSENSDDIFIDISFGFANIHRPPGPLKCSRLHASVHAYTVKCLYTREISSSSVAICRLARPQNSLRSVWQ